MDTNGMEILARDECLDLLRSKPVARLGLSVKALPVILPVNFIVHDDQIVIGTAAGSKLAAALDRAVVAVEVDDFDVLSHTGWSVLVRGGCRVIADSWELDVARDLWLQPWVDGAADHWIAVATELISGRRIRRDHHADRTASVRDRR